MKIISIVLSLLISLNFNTLSVSDSLNHASDLADYYLSNKEDIGSATDIENTAESSEESGYAPLYDLTELGEFYKGMKPTNNKGGYTAKQEDGTYPEYINGLKFVDNPNAYLYDVELTLPEQYSEEDLRALTCMVFNENGLINNEVLVVYGDDPISEGVYRPADVIHEWQAQVCLNHVADPRFPNTVYDDIDLPRYGPAYRDPELAAKCEAEHPNTWKRIRQSCLIAMNGYVEIPSNVIYANNYMDLGETFAKVWVDTGWFRSWSHFAKG